MVFKKGEIGHAKLTWEQVREIRALRAELHVKQRKRVPRDDHRSVSSLAEQFGVSRTTIEAIINGRTWNEGQPYTKEKDRHSSKEDMAMEPRAESGEEAS